MAPTDAIQVTMAALSARLGRSAFSSPYPNVPVTVLVSSSAPRVTSAVAVWTAAGVATGDGWTHEDPAMAAAPAAKTTPPPISMVRSVIIHR